MSLVKAEVRRLSKRRLTRFMLVFLVLGLGAIAVGMMVASKQITPERRAEAAAASQRDYEEALRDHRRSVADCEAAKAAGRTGLEERYGPNCGADWAPTPDMFDPKWNLPYEFVFREQFDVLVSVFGGILAMFAFIVAASYVGAEWNSGGMMNLLLWRPKRLSVLFSKLGVLLGGVLGVGLLLGSLWTLWFWLLGRYDGQLGKLTPGVWRSLALTGARGLGLALAVATVGFGLASLGRHTAMALGVAVGVGVVSEIGLRIAFEIIGVSFPQRYVLSTYATSWFLKKVTLEDWTVCDFQMGRCEPASYTVTWQHSALLFGVGTAAVLAAAVWAMRRRDVT